MKFRLITGKVRNRQVTSERVNSTARRNPGIINKRCTRLRSTVWKLVDIVLATGTVRVGNDEDVANLVGAESRDSGRESGQQPHLLSLLVRKHENIARSVPILV